MGVPPTGSGCEPTASAAIASSRSRIPNAVLVCGGRDYADADYVNGLLDNIHRRKRIDVLIHGGAPGADTMAHEWAVSRAVARMVFPADWKAHGRAAGPIRNQQMIDEGMPDLVVAFPGGRGTRDMARRAKKAGIQLIEHR